MTRQEVCDVVFKLINQILEEKNVKLNSAEEDISDLLNSIEFVTLVVEIESAFQIEFNDDDFDLDKMSSVNSIADLIMKYHQ